MARSHRIAAALLAGSVMAATGLATAAPSQAAGSGSEFTVRAKDYALTKDKGPFPNLEMTVSQSKDLVSQGVTVSFKGGPGTSEFPTSTGGQNFLQIFQCWGDDPANPGHPDRRTCQYGGVGTPGATRDGTFDEPTDVHPKDARYTADIGWTWSEIPFVGWNDRLQVDETKAPTESVITHLKWDNAGVATQDSTKTFGFDSNPLFDKTSTNELRWVPFGQNGSGSVAFNVQTTLDAPGLGCGNPVTVGGQTKGSSCWLVAVPRPKADNARSGITQSGLLWDSWQHHIAVKLDFKPLGAKCAMGVSERQLAGTELAANAVGQWQPKLCQADGRPMNLTTLLPETSAVDHAMGEAPSAMALTTRAVDAERVPDGDPLVYAPILLSGVTVSFAHDSVPKGDAPEAHKAKANTPMTPMKLTPRLLAKLLTASYLDATPITRDGQPDKSYLADPRPRNIVADPDFLAVNGPEWSEENTGPVDIQVPGGTSTMTRAVWEYILADPEAAAFLNGEPDQWGMKVNPWYSTNPAVNKGGEFVLPQESFPKADPVDTGVVRNWYEQPVNLVTWRPYTYGYGDGANRVLRGDRQTLGAWDPNVQPPKYGSSPPQLPGRRDLMALSTSPAAHQFQTATALLRNPAGNFVAPTAASMSAAAAAMVPESAKAVTFRFDAKSPEAKKAADAYPLTVPVYAALNPLQTDAAERAGYATFIEYAVGPGQVPGLDDGQLPPGYVPLPKAWIDQAKKAATAIREGISPLAEAPEPETEQPTEPAATQEPPQEPVEDTAGDEPSEETTDDTTSTDEQTDEPADEATDPEADSGDSATSAEHQQPGTGDEPKQTGAGRTSTTPADPETNPLAAVIPVTGVLGLASALGLPLASRLRRRDTDS